MVQLKSFLILVKFSVSIKKQSMPIKVKKCMDGKDLSKLPLSALQPATTSQIDGPKKKLVVVKRGDYPSKGFPHTLEHLQVSIQNLAPRCLCLNRCQGSDWPGWTNA